MKKMNEQPAKPRIFAIGAIILLLVISAGACLGEVKKPAFSGTFYPERYTALNTTIKSFIWGAGQKRVQGELIGIIVPHGAYEYSGQVAAYAYKELVGRSYDTIIIMGPSHNVYFDGISVATYDAFATPFGSVPVDLALSRKIIAYNPKKISFNRAAEESEHSIEVELPFIQWVQPRPRIVSIIFGNQSIENCKMAASAILSAIGKRRVLLIASTDLSHYDPYSKAMAMDAAALKDIENNNAQGLLRNVSIGAHELCGYGAVITLMILANELGANNIQILNYANSGDVSGDRASVVGYASIAFSRGKAPGGLKK